MVRDSRWLDRWPTALLEGRWTGVPPALLEDPTLEHAVNIYTTNLQWPLGALAGLRFGAGDCRLRKTCILQQSCNKTCILAS